MIKKHLEIIGDNSYHTELCDSINIKSVGNNIHTLKLFIDYNDRTYLLNNGDLQIIKIDGVSVFNKLEGKFLIF